MAQKRSSTRTLDPGQDTISEVKGRRQADGTYWLDWSYRPMDGSKTKQRRSKGRTIGEARRRAHDKAEQLRADSRLTTWKSRDRLADYIEKVGKKAINEARLAEASQERYLGVLRYLVGDCSEHRHESSLKEHTIASGTRFRVLERCLQEIAATHGSETAHQARSVLGKYVLDQLIRDDLIVASPIAGKRIDLSGGKSRERARGGVSLTVEQWNAVIDHLLTLDPADGVEKPKRGMYTLEDRIAVKANAIDLTILQALTGLRIGEATAITWEMVELADEAMVLHLPPEVVKTRRGRTLYVTTPEAIERFRERRDRAGDPAEFVIGSPAKPDVVWQQRQRNEAVKTLYLAMAKDLGIEALKVERSHVWRATVNTLTMAEGVPEAVRTAHLGHTAQVSRAHYTDTSDGSLLADSLRRLRPA